MILNIMWKHPRFDTMQLNYIDRLQLSLLKKKDTLIADTITGNPVVYIVGYKANKYYKINRTETC